MPWDVWGDGGIWISWDQATPWDLSEPLLRKPSHRRV